MCAELFRAIVAVSFVSARRRTSPTARYDRKDAFYRRAREEGYRSRAAYKLIDLLRRVALPGNARVVELGCWPGAWLQVLGERLGSESRIVGVDIVAMDPLEGVEFVQGDFTEPAVMAEIEARLGGPAHAVFSDAAPKLTGIRDLDRAALEELALAALHVSERVLAKGGTLIIKGFPGPEADQLRAELRRRFAVVNEVRPEGKRSTSKEFYWVAGEPPRRTSRGRRRRR